MFTVELLYIAKNWIHVFIVGWLIRFKTMGLYSQNNAFWSMMIKWKIVEKILNFSNMKKGGAERGCSGFWNSMNIGSNLKKVEKCRISILEVWKLKGGPCSGTLIPTIYSTIRDSDCDFGRHICIFCRNYHWISYLDICPPFAPPFSKFWFFKKMERHYSPE